MRVRMLHRVLLTAGAGTLLAAMVAILPATVTSASPGQHYTWTTINVPGALYTVADGVNDFGAVAGWYAVSATAYDQGFVEQGGHFTTIDDPAGVDGTIVTWDNDLGVIGGYYLDANYIAHGFTDIHGTFTTITDPNGGTTQGSGQGTYPAVENLEGVIAGFYADNNNVEHGFTYQDGHFITIDAPLAGTTPNANPEQGTYIGFVNDFGELTGAATENDGSSYSFIDNHGRYTTIFDPLGVTDGTYIGSVNDFGLSVGVYYDTNDAMNGFVESNGTYTTIDDPAALTGAFQGTAPESSNNLGTVVGFYVASNGWDAGFELTVY